MRKSFLNIFVKAANMCGIFGLAVKNGHPMDRSAFDTALGRLFLLSESRGKEAAGIALATAGRLIAHKDSISAGEMLKTADYSQAVKRGIDPYFEEGAPSLAALGHARLVTNGLQAIDANNQPVWRDDIVIIHNGIVVNWEPLWQANPDIKPNAEVDTEVIAALIHKATKSSKKSPAEAMASVFNSIEGETSVGFFSKDTNAMWLGTNTGSVYYCISQEGAFFFASEHRICKELVTGSNALTGFADAEIRQLRPGHGLILKLDTLEEHEFSFSDQLPAPQIGLQLGMQRVIEDKASRIQEARNGLLRCTRCLLPSTMPFIAYDADGVCNYCHDHHPWERQDESVLLGKLALARSTDSSPDCLMPFSGDRDSSYGLHLLKTKYGMTPLTFSYDWGMETDLARRNRARMCGELGVEHVWISADVRQKRRNVQRNIQAWLNKPDLGVVPLFSAGSKRFFWHANEMIQKSRIPQMVFPTNRYEETDIESGFLNIRPRKNSKQWSEKFELIYRCGSRVLGNPRYINPSIGDTLRSFSSHSALSENHLHLFDYADWNEGEVEATLFDRYNWEIADDTDSSWRVGDSTAPFYNYIYHTVAGFTENDAFRSNQIRDGKITREEGLRLVKRDNLPRWKSIREYCSLINVDFGELIRGIDRIPKLYMDDRNTSLATA